MKMTEECTVHISLLTDYIKLNFYKVWLGLVGGNDSILDDVGKYHYIFLSLVTLRIFGL